MKHWAISMMRRRSKLSASAPETSENSMIGSDVEACTSATMFTESEIDVIIQAAPTRLDQAAEIRGEARQPDDAEGVVPERRQWR